MQSVYNKLVDVHMEYKGLRWNEEDLCSSKQAVEILALNGESVEDILTMQDNGFFGNLDVCKVLEELGF